MPRAFQHAHRALHVRIHVFGRRFDRRDDVADAGEVENVVALLENRRRRLQAADVFPVAREIAVGLVMVEVRLVATDKIVDDAHLESTVEQQIDHVTADEARTTRHHRA